VPQLWCGTDVARAVQVREAKTRLANYETQDMVSVCVNGCAV
jgi:hypothetical protein